MQEQIIAALSRMEEGQAKQVMLQLKSEYPDIYNKVMELLRQRSESKPGQKPLPEQRPPRRELSPVYRGVPGTYVLYT